MNLEISDWVKVVKEDHLLNQTTIFGEVCALGEFEGKPIASIRISDEKFLTVATELIVEIRKKNG